MREEAVGVAAGRHTGAQGVEDDQLGEGPGRGGGGGGGGGRGPLQHGGHGALQFMPGGAPAATDAPQSRK